MAQRLQRWRKAGKQRNVGVVHAVVAAAGGNLDHGLRRTKGVAPADAHLDRIIAQQKDRVRLCDQRHHRQGILRAMAIRYQVDDAFEQWLDAFLAQMVEWKLMARDGDEYLSLAILEESVASAGQDTAA